MRSLPLRGGRLGMPVPVVGGCLFRLTFAVKGSWWMVRVPYPARAVYEEHEHRLRPVVVRGKVGGGHGGGSGSCRPDTARCFRKRLPGRPRAAVGHGPAQQSSKCWPATCIKLRGKE